LNLLSGFFEMRLKNPSLIQVKKSKKLSPKTQNFSKKFESRQKAALKE